VLDNLNAGGSTAGGAGMILCVQNCSGTISLAAETIVSSGQLMVILMSVFQIQVTLVRFLEKKDHMEYFLTRSWIRRKEILKITRHGTISVIMETVTMHI